jgi:hypothetical protein
MSVLSIYVILAVILTVTVAVVVLSQREIPFRPQRKLKVRRTSLSVSVSPNTLSKLSCLHRYTAYPHSL